jgi:hypothetical protein
MNGLKISTECKFIKFIAGNNFSIRDDFSVSTCKVTFINGTRAGDIVDSNAECVDKDVVLQSTGWIKIYNPILYVEGIVLQSYAPFEYQVQQFIVDGITKFYTDFNEGMCRILVPKSKITDIDGYIEVINSIPYLELLEVTEDAKELKNIYGVQLYRTNLRLENLNSIVFNPKDSYDRYLIRDVDYLGTFILKLESILNQYGVALHRYPIDTNTPRSDRLIYKITEYQVQESPKSNYGPFRDVVRHKTTIEFEGSFLNQVVFEDFRTRYQDVRLLTDFTTFYVETKHGKKILASLKWSQINTDWNPDYNVDNQGNSGIPCTFNVELRYYVIYDRAYYNIIHAIDMTIIGDKFMHQAPEVDTEDAVVENTLDDKPIKQNNTNLDSTDIHQVASEDLDEWLKLRSN